MPSLAQHDFCILFFHLFSLSCKTDPFVIREHLNLELANSDRIFLCFLLGQDGSKLSIPHPTPQPVLCPLMFRSLSYWIWFWSLPIVGRNHFTVLGGCKRKWSRDPGGWGCRLQTQGKGAWGAEGIWRKWAQWNLKASSVPWVLAWRVTSLKDFLMGPGKFKQKEEESDLGQSIRILLVMNYQLLTERQLIPCWVRTLVYVPSLVGSSSLTLHRARLTVGLTNIYRIELNVAATPEAPGTCCLPRLSELLSHILRPCHTPIGFTFIYAFSP